MVGEVSRWLVVAAALVGFGCGESSGDSADNQDGVTATPNDCVAIEEPTVDCLLFYRPTIEADPSGEPPAETERHVTFGPAPSESFSTDPSLDQTIAIGEFVFDGRLWNDPYEGPGFEVEINAETTDGSAHLFSQLYQFGDAICNQFSGDHGFTGLAYVAHPETTGELQFTCSIE